jgi:hypothetical protein
VDSPQPHKAWCGCGLELRVVIVVTGTMRSGTSMWMQVLHEAGLPVIGEAFPRPWGEALRSANPRGFYECQLTAGIYHATNPHPQTGAYLFPEATRRHVVKVFVPGLVRSDVAFLDAVVATVRHWRAVAASIEQMRTLAGPGSPGHVPVDIPAPLLWWAETFALVRDIATRRYAAHVVTYERVVADPGQEVRVVLDWLGLPQVEAQRAVDPALCRSRQAEVDTTGLRASHLEVFDELHAKLDEGAPLAPAFVQRLNQVDAELRPWLQAIRERVRQDLLARCAGPHDEGGAHVR